MTHQPTNAQDDAAIDDIEHTFYDVFHSMSQPSMRGKKWGELLEYAKEHLMPKIRALQSLTAPSAGVSRVKLALTEAKDAMNDYLNGGDAGFSHPISLCEQALQSLTDAQGWRDISKAREYMERMKEQFVTIHDEAQRAPNGLDGFTQAEAQQLHHAICEIYAYSEAGQEIAYDAIKALPSPPQPAKDKSK